MNKRIIGVVVAVLLAALGTVFLTGYVRAAEDRALAGQETVEVLVVNEQVAPDTPAEDVAAFVSAERVPAKVRAADSVDDLDALDGQVTTVALVPGEQLVTTRFATPAQLAEQRGVEIPEGLQQVTISLDPQRAVGGQISPGSVVGLLASFTFDGDEEDQGVEQATKMNHQQVLVTNVQADRTASSTSESEGEGEAAGPAPVPSGSLLITLAVDTEQAERIVFAAEFGSLWLTAQDEDTDQGGSAIRHGGNIYDD